MHIYKYLLIRLKWKAPAQDGGSPVTFYVVEYKQRTEEEWTQFPKTKVSSSLTPAHADIKDMFPL